MMSIEEKRREVFGWWAIAEATRREYPFMSRVIARHTDGSYATTWVDSAWLGFNAALDAVVIVLPDCDHLDGGYYCDGYTDGIDACKSVLEAAGVEVK